MPSLEVIVGPTNGKLSLGESEGTEEEISLEEVTRTTEVGALERSVGPAGEFSLGETVGPVDG
jgi:hypothetical protein